MVNRRLGRWARWCLILGFFLPALSFFLIKDYDYSESAYVNAMTKQVELPFMYGNNPIACLDHSLRSTIGGALGQKVEANYSCLLPTRLSFLTMLTIGGGLFLLGLFGFFHREEFANLWPTEWVVFDKNSVQKEEAEIQVELDRNIKGKDAGY